MNRLLWLSVFVISCKTTPSSDLSASSVVSERNFSVEKMPAASSVANAKDVYLIRVKPTADQLRGFVFTAGNPELVDNATSYAVAEETCRNLNYGGLTGWRLPTLKEWNDLLAMDFFHVGTGEASLDTRGAFWINSEMLTFDPNYRETSLRLTLHVKYFLLTQPANTDGGENYYSKSVWMGNYYTKEEAEKDYELLRKTKNLKNIPLRGGGYANDFDEGMKELKKFMDYKYKFICAKPPY